MGLEVCSSLLCREMTAECYFPTPMSGSARLDQKVIFQMFFSLLLFSFAYRQGNNQLLQFLIYSFPETVIKYWLHPPSLTKCQGMCSNLHNPVASKDHKGLVRQGPLLLQYFIVKV